MEELWPANRPDSLLATPGGQTGNHTQEDSEKGMWTMYMHELKEPDNRITDIWKDDATALVTFTSLFSAIIAAFIIESYKKLSPDTGGQTVDLLRRISQQLASPTNYTVPTQVVTQPPYPTALNVCVNAMWLTSLVLSISSAMFSTLLQQWARSYIQKPKIPTQQMQRARVRWFLYRGTKTFKMRLVVEIAPTLLHLSIFLFFAGLGMFFVPINKTVGIVVSVIVGIVGLAYLTLTILPCIKHNCPYRTPMTPFCWYTWHTLLFLATYILRGAGDQLRSFLVPYYQGRTSERSPIPQIENWLESRKHAVKKHRDCLTNGLDKGTIKEAENAPEDEDREMLTWLLNQLAVVDESKFREFVAIIPRSTIARLMRTSIEYQLALCELLLPLIRSCAGTSASKAREAVRRQALYKCLEAVRHVAEAFSINPDAIAEEVILHIRIHFANTDLMRAMWNDVDAAIRLTSRSICALLARCIMHRTPDDLTVDWLQDVTGDTQTQIHGSPIAERDHMILKFFVSGVLSPPTANLPTELVASFVRTLAMLTGSVMRADADVDNTILRMGLQNFIERMQHDGNPDSVIGTLQQILQRIP